MDASGNCPSPTAQQRTPPRPQEQRNMSPRTERAWGTPTGPRPPVPKKPPIAHVKPLIPRNTSSPGSSPDLKSSPGNLSKSPGGVTGKVPPPLPKVPPKGGTGSSDSPPVSKKVAPSSTHNGSICKAVVKQDGVDLDQSLTSSETENGTENNTEIKSPSSVYGNSPGRKDTNELSHSTDSDLGDLSLNAASSFFDEVMSAIGHNTADITSASVNCPVSQSVSPGKMDAAVSRDKQITKNSGENQTDSSISVPNVDEKGDRSHVKSPSKAYKKSNVSPIKPTTPPTLRPKPMKRLSLSTRSELSPIQNDEKSVPNTPSDKPSLKPKPVPRKRLPMPNLSSIENLEPTSISKSLNSEDSNTDQLSQSTIESPPQIPSKSHPRVKGRLSLDTYFLKPSLSLDIERCGSPLSTSFEYSDSDDTPRRPPRPRRKKTLLGHQNLSLDVSSAGDLYSKSCCEGPNGSKENIDIHSKFQDVSLSASKVPPIKPKRKTIPRVNRSLSDVSSAASFVAHVHNQKDAKQHFLKGQPVHSHVSELKEDVAEGRPRSQTSEAIMSPPPTCSSDSPLHSSKEECDGSGDKSLKPQRVNPFNKDTSLLAEEPDFHCDTMLQNNRTAKRSANVLSPIFPNKNNKLPLVKLKPTRKAPPPPRPAVCGSDVTSHPHPSSSTKTELNNNKPETAQSDLNKSGAKPQTSEMHEYEVVPAHKQDRIQNLAETKKESCSKDLQEEEEASSSNVSAPIVPPRVSTCRKSILEMTPPVPPCAAPRSRKGKGNLDEDDGYIYPEDVPIEFAESKLWPKNKILRPQSAFAGSSDSSKSELSELSGSPMTGVKFKHLSLMSEGSSQSDHSSDGPQRLSSFMLDRSSSEDSMCDELGSEGKGKRREKIYYIVEEIVNSEKVFVDVLKLLNVEFRLAVSTATEKAGKPVIAAETLNRILNFLPQLQNFNEELLKDLKERLGKWDEERKVADIFVKKGPFLKLYTSYIKNFQSMTELLHDSCKKNPAFATVVKDFERTPKCASLALQHYMLKPIQRIPQYKLLLQDYKKHLTPDSPDYEATNTALDIVSEVADHANESMRYGDTVQKLLSIQHSLIGQFEVIKPGRVLLKQGELLKLSRKEMQPRMFFLFSDVLLYTTPNPGGYKLNNVLSLTSMKVGQENQEDYKNEFSITSVQRSFTVSTRTAEEKEEWLCALQNAIKEHAHKRSTFDFGRHNSQPDLNRDFTLGSKAPVWIPDSRVTMCMMCTVEFTVTWRRHHCRACGKVVCGSCSENRAPLQYLDDKVGRVCDECFENLHDDIEEKSKSLGRGEALDSTDASNLSIAGLKARFMQIRRSARTFRGSGAKRRPAVLKEVHANDQGSTMSGYLKQHKGRKWRKLWFVLKDKVLYTYKASKDMAAIESYPLLGYDVVKMTEPYEGIEPGFVFQCKHKNTDPLVFRSDNQGTTDKWVELMREASVA